MASFSNKKTLIFSLEPVDRVIFRNMKAKCTLKSFLHPGELLGAHLQPTPRERVFD